MTQQYSTPYFPCWLHLKNGWTLSISMGDFSPAICSIGAWPSAYDGSQDDVPWFKFEVRPESGPIRCFNLNDFRMAVLEVEKAEPPPPAPKPMCEMPTSEQHARVMVLLGERYLNDRGLR